MPIGCGTGPQLRLPAHPLGRFLNHRETRMPEQVLIAKPLPARSAPGALSGLPTLKLDQVKTQRDAFQSLGRDLATMIDRLGDVMASAHRIYATLGVTRTRVRGLAEKGKVRKTGRRRKRYHVRDLLLAVLDAGTGRARRTRRGVGYGQPGKQPGPSGTSCPVPPTSPYGV